MPCRGRRAVARRRWAAIHDLALLNATSAPSLDILSADAAVAVDIGSRAEQGADLPDRQNILSESRIGEITILYEDPAFEHGGDEAFGAPIA